MSEVLLCTYNGSRFIVEQLRSILDQTVPVTKISIHDDRSIDDTVSKVREFVAHLPCEQQCLFNIHINERNLGFARNFANAIAMATGDILFLCDQDDVWESNKVETLLRLLSETSCDMAFSDGSLIDEASRELTQNTVLQSYGLSEGMLQQFRHRSFELLMKRNYINGAAAAVRRSATQAALPLPCDMPHDYWLAIWCSIHGGIVATPEVLYRYRLHEHNAIGIGKGNALDDVRSVWRHGGAPRERELRIWRAITQRISAVSCGKHVDLANRKLLWLTRVTDHGKTWSRGLAILRSALNGSYARYSGQHALLRDLVSLMK